MTSKEYQKEYYEKNKDKIKQAVKSQVSCDICDKTMSRCNYYSHIKTKIHKKNFEKQNKSTEEKQYNWNELNKKIDSILDKLELSKEV